MQRVFYLPVFYFVDDRSDQLQVSQTEVAERDVVINPGMLNYVPACYCMKSPLGVITMIHLRENTCLIMH